MEVEINQSLFEGMRNMGALNFLWRNRDLPTVTKLEMQKGIISPSCYGELVLNEKTKSRS